MELTAQSKTYPAQIMLVALLILMIIGIIVVGVVGVSSRDVLQTASNQQYQKLYNDSESTIYQVIDKYGDSTVSLSSITSENFGNGSCASVDSSTFNCNFTAQDGAATKLTIADTPKVQNYQLSKDDSLELDLSGYRGQLIVGWTGRAALEFGLIYDESGVTKYIGDIFDTASIYDSTGNSPTQRSLPEDHPFLFSDDPSGGINFKIDNIQGLPPTARTVSLRITARMDSTQALTKVNVDADNGFPKQLRQLTATSFDPNSDVQSTATVVTQIPLLAQAPSPFDYALLTQDTIDKSGAQLISTHTLNVTISGLGAGSVTGPQGISCPSTCSADYDIGTIVPLTPIYAAGSYFAGWSGDCDASGKVTISSDKTCIATFSVLPAPVAGDTARMSAAGTVFGNKMYVYGGSNAAVLNIIWNYDFSTGTWTQGTAGGGARRDVAEFVSGTSTYYWGGSAITGATVYNLLYSFDSASGTWTTRATGGTARYKATAAVYNNKAYIYGGCTTGANCTVLSNILSIYDIAANTWAVGTAGPTAIGGATSFVYNNKMYVVGGQTAAAKSSTTTLIFDFASNTWSAGAAGGNGMYDAQGVVVGNKIYLIGGCPTTDVTPCSGTATNSVAIYDPSNNTWSAGVAGGKARDEATVVAVGNKIYVWGGNSAGNFAGFTNTFNVYDTTLNQWTN